MANQLKPGGMGSPAAVGMPPEFSDSMASAIESALNTLLAGEGKDTLDVNDNSPDTRDRRMLFVAIAQGVVNHLVANQAAFVIHLQFSGGHVTGATLEIRT